MGVEHASLLVAYLEAGDSEAYEALRDVLTPDIVTHTAGAVSYTHLTLPTNA